MNFIKFCLIIFSVAFTFAGPIADGISLVRIQRELDRLNILNVRLIEQVTNLRLELQLYKELVRTTPTPLHLETSHQISTTPSSPSLYSSYSSCSPWSELDSSDGGVELE